MKRLSGINEDLRNRLPEKLKIKRTKSVSERRKQQACQPKKCQIVSLKEYICIELNSGVYSERFCKEVKQDRDLYDEIKESYK